jgi:hypothetical protein
VIDLGISVIRDWPSIREITRIVADQITSGIEDRYTKDHVDWQDRKGLATVRQLSGVEAIVLVALDGVKPVGPASASDEFA